MMPSSRCRDSDLYTNCPERPGDLSVAAGAAQWGSLPNVVGREGDGVIDDVRHGSGDLGSDLDCSACAKVVAWRHRVGDTGQVDALVVRHAVEDDFAEWLALFEEVAAEGRWIGAEAPLDRERARRVFDARLDSEQAVTLIAEANGILVGHLGVHLAGGVADLGMMVRDGNRGQGHGSRLVEGCIDWSRAHGAHKVTLSVWPHNERALRLYANHGFVIEGRLRRHWRRRNGELWDALLMGLVLDADSHSSPYE